MRRSEAQKSRRKTPWDGESKLTPTQAFLKAHYDERYVHHHRSVKDSGEEDMINSYAPTKCPFCDSDKIKKNGHTDSGVQRYKCYLCGKHFTLDKLSSQQLWSSYTEGKQTYAQLALQYGCSIMGLIQIVKRDLLMSFLRHE